MNRYWTTDKRLLFDKDGGFVNNTDNTNNVSPHFRHHRDSAIWIDWDGDGADAILKLQVLKPGVDPDSAGVNDWGFIRENDDGASVIGAVAFLPTGIARFTVGLGYISTAPGTRTAPSMPIAAGWARFHLDFQTDPAALTPTIEVYHIVPFQGASI